MKYLIAFMLFTCALVSSSSAHAQPAAAQGGQAADEAVAGEGDRGAAPIRFMSFNILWGGSATPPSIWGKRRDRVIETIKAYDPDILGVQESLLAQSKFVRNNLDGYIFYGAGRDNGVLAGQMCAVFYRGSRFRRVGGGHFWLSEEPETAGSYGWGSSYPRMVTWLRLRDRSDGRTFVFANTQFDRRKKKARLNAALLLREKMKELAGGDPVVILGDLKCDEDSEPYAALMGLNEGEVPWLIDAYREVHPERSDQEATYHGFRGGTGGSRIDFVLHTSGFQALAAGIDTTHEGLKYPSNHFPVTATLVRVDDPATEAEGQAGP
jgi:endonuclease/exonuclease/phosphatase family metal-dependent hydrolase